MRYFMDRFNVGVSKDPDKTEGPCNVCKRLSPENILKKSNFCKCQNKS